MKKFEVEYDEQEPKSLLRKSEEKQINRLFKWKLIVMGVIEVLIGIEICNDKKIDPKKR